MAYTEKVSLSGTALSFLTYECTNSIYSQEGFLVGEITSEITNHISDAHSDAARLDTQIVIRTVLPLPSVSLFYQPTGQIKEDVLRELLSSNASDIVGWYKFRKNNNLKPTFRDKLVCKALQKYFEKYHGKKNYVMCNITNKSSITDSTHTFMYRFGKINCLDMYEYIEDVTGNLGEKLTGYKKAYRHSPHSIFNKILKESNVQNSNTAEAILHIQEAVDVRLKEEARLAAKTELTIREIEAEIQQLTMILTDKHTMNLQAAYDKMAVEKSAKVQEDIAFACAQALVLPSQSDNNVNQFLMDNHIEADSDHSTKLLMEISKERSPSPLLMSRPAPAFNYAAALKKNSNNSVPASSTATNHDEDLISFDIDEKTPSKLVSDDEVHCIGDSSPEY